MRTGSDELRATPRPPAAPSRPGPARAPGLDGRRLGGEYPPMSADPAAPWHARAGRAGPGGHPEIRTENLSKSFGANHVLRGLSIQINAGEIVAIVGTSGSGKTVLLDCITGLMEPTSGRVLVADHGAPAPPHSSAASAVPPAHPLHAPARPDGRVPLVDLSAVDADTLDRIRLHWAVVFQKNALFSGTVYDNIALWLREHTAMAEEEIRAVAARSLEAVALDVSDVLYKDREALSGGMAKRVAIARAIAVDPLVIFYDEPTTGLDPVVSGQIHELIWKSHHLPHASGSPRTTVIVTHDKELLRRLAPRIIMLDGGRVGFDGTYEQFSLADTGAAAQYLKVMPVLHARGDL